MSQPLAAQANHRLLPIHCGYCHKPAKFSDFEVWKHDLADNNTGGTHKSSRDLTVSSVDNALEIQKSQPNLQFHIKRKCTHCQENNYHRLFGTLGNHGFPCILDSRKITQYVSRLRRQWKKTHPLPGLDDTPDENPFDDLENFSPDEDDEDPRHALPTHGDYVEAIWESYADLMSYMPSETNDSLLSQKWLHGTVAHLQHCATTVQPTEQHVQDAKRILGQCCYQKEFTQEKISNVVPESFELYLKIGELVLMMDNHGRELLSTVLRLSLQEHFKHHTGDESFLDYPTTEREFHSEYLNPNNSNSLVNNIPIPTVESIQEHSYSNFLEMIKYISLTTPD